MGKGSGTSSRPAMSLPSETVQAIAGLIHEPLLSREQWRNEVFARSEGHCVVCGETAADAHHLIERKLFTEDGGYYLSNGVALCHEHHYDAEGCALLPSELRSMAHINLTVLPPEAATDDEYDKWLNPIDSQGIRHVGPLFWEESCQKALARSGTLVLYQRRVKYPRTFHLPWSPGKSADDLAFDSDIHFRDKEVVVTIKMDGENTTIGNDYVHARSVDSKYHPSRTWVNALGAQVGHQLPQGWRVTGENLQAQHSIVYDKLPSYFMVFSIWNEKNECLSWDETEEWCELLELQHVPDVYRGTWDPEAIQSAFDNYQSPWSGEAEGYVVRTTAGFGYRAFRESLAKYVRPNHVQTEGHWMHQEMHANGLES